MSSVAAQLSAYERRTNPDTYGVIAPPTTFLSLAPTTSSSYPTHRRTSSEEKPAVAAARAMHKCHFCGNESAIIEEPASTTTSIANPIAGEISPALTNRTRRTSSMTSNGSGIGRRFLKLGPIHGWEDHSAVWSEVVE